MASCGLPSAVSGARMCELGSTTRPDIDADCRIDLGTASRALAEQNEKGAYTACTLAACEIEDSSCDVQHERPVHP